MEKFMETLSKVQHKNFGGLLSKRNFKIPEIKLLNQVLTNWSDVASTNFKHSFKWWMTACKDL